MIQQWYGEFISLENRYNEIWLGTTVVGRDAGHPITQRPLTDGLTRVKSVWVLDSDRIGTVSVGYGNRIYAAEINELPQQYRNVYIVEIAYAS